MSADPRWPGDAPTLTRWVRAHIREDGAEFVRGLESVRVTAELSGADVETLSIDATGVELIPQAPPTATPVPAGASAEKRAVEHRSHGVLRAARVTAAPVRIDGIPVTIDAQLADAPVEWLTYDRPRSADSPHSIHDVELTEDGTGMRGSVTASLSADDLSPLLGKLLRPAFDASRGVRLRRLKVKVTQDGADGIRVDGEAAVRWRLLWVSARGSARIGISARGVVTIRDLRASSRNPFIAAALIAARSAIRKQVGTSFDLNEDLPAGPRLSDVRVVAAERLTVSARLA